MYWEMEKHFLFWFRYGILFQWKAKKLSTGRARGSADLLNGLFDNKCLMIVLITMLFTQIIKGTLYCCLSRHFSFSRFFGDGGMPSAHAATVSSLCTSCGIICGLGSTEFAICVVLTLIVCRDAIGVRLETGKQASVINDIVEVLTVLGSKELPDEKLKEFVGHTPAQVIVGLLVGVISALILSAIL